VIAPTLIPRKATAVALVCCGNRLQIIQSAVST
jgi:hypothetical protein